MAATSASTLTLTDFLLARIAEDRDRELPYEDDYRCVGTAERDEVSAINAYWDRRWAAECEAKRRIVGIYELVEFGEDMDGKLAPLGGDGPETYWDVMRELATVYADHPDYRPEWRP